MEPLQIDLRLSERLHHRPPSLVGGDPDLLITKIQNDMYRYLVGSSESSKPFVLQFNDRINTRRIGSSQYLDKGGITAVFAVNCIDNTAIPILPLAEVLILRLVEYNPRRNTVGELISKYKTDKSLFPENMIDIYAYGNVLKSDGSEIIGQYVLTKQYLNHNDIVGFSYNEKLELLMNLIVLLVNISRNRYFYRDLKFQNIGAERKNGKIKFIILDYDPITLLTATSPFFRQFTRCNHYCVGTFTPYYMINDLSPDWLSRYDKIYSKGLAEIIIKLFFVRNRIYNAIIANIYIIKPELLIKSIEQINYNYLMSNISLLQPLYSEIDDNKKNVLIALIQNLLHKEYKSILIPRGILTIMQNTFFNTPLITQIIIPIADHTPLEINPEPIAPASFQTPQSSTTPFQTPSSSTTPHTNTITPLPPVNADLSHIALDISSPDTSSIMSKMEAGYLEKYLKYKKKYLELKKLSNYN